MWSKGGAPMSKGGAGGQQKGKAANTQGMMWPKGSGGKGAVKQSPAATRAALEAKLIQLADNVHEVALDLNVDMNKLDSHIEKLKSTRVQLLASYGIHVPQLKPKTCVAPQRKAAGNTQQLAMFVPGGNKFTPKPNVSQDGAISWKSTLAQACYKRSKASPEKGEFQYETVEDPAGGYMSTITSVSGMLQASYCSPAPSPSKKGAENEAAKVAYQHEFPDLFPQVSAQAGGVVSKVPQIQPAKRKHDQMIAEISAKCELHESIFLLVDRSSVKEDIVYETADCEGGGYASTVRLPYYDESLSWTCSFAESKKLAEDGASKLALADLRHIIEPLKENHRQKKAKIAKEKRDALQAKKKGEVAEPVIAA